MAAGDSAAERAVATRESAARYRQRADRAERAAEEWLRGARGERVLAEVTGPLIADGYYHLHDRGMPGSTANLDHLLVGPAGVFVIDAKSWTGRISVDGSVLRQNGRRRDDHLERSRRQASELAIVLEQALGAHRVPVRPVLCFVGDHGIDTPTIVDRVYLLNSGELVAFVRRFERRLEQTSVDEAMKALLQALPARTRTIAGSRTAAPMSPPIELLVYLQPWCKHGRRRLYAKASDGSEVGFLDLMSGEVRAEGEEWQPILAQLLPHYVTDGDGMARVEPISGEARGALRRFVAAVLGRTDSEPARTILVGYHWTNYGKDRLYLHRIEGGGVKQELGWFDRERGIGGTTDPKAAAVVAYCGDRFRTVVRR
ncbi:MAG: NERD domain-containing protein [Actinomycetota bacterium]|nr:NERD domain-containing protein [Actinomycetota bacterium]